MLRLFTLAEFGRTSCPGGQFVDDIVLPSKASAVVAGDLWWAADQRREAVSSALGRCTAALHSDLFLRRIEGWDHEQQRSLALLRSDREFVVSAIACIYKSR